MSVERAREFLEDVLEHADHPPGILSGTTLLKIEKALRELQPEPRVLDWQKVVDNGIPVKVRNNHPAELAFLRSYCPGIVTPFGTYAGGHFSDASLETGQWVFNSSGENVWPEGVVFKAWQRSGAIQEFCSCDVWADWWRLDEGEDNIIASRAVGLEEGWSYGGGQ